MIELIASTATRILGMVGSVLGGIVLGLFFGVWFVIATIRRTVNKNFDHDQLKIEDEDEKRVIARYVKNCEDALSSSVRRKMRAKKTPMLIRKIKEMRAARKNEVTEPPDEENSVQSVTFDGKTWYPVYLMLHNIGAYYRGDEPLSFLDLTEKEVFDIVRKTALSINTIFNALGVESLKKLKCYTLMETMDLLVSVVLPFSKGNFFKAVKFSSNRFTEVMKIKNIFSINPFYYLKRYVKRRVTVEITIECVKCAVEIIAAEIVSVYKGRDNKSEIRNKEIKK